jgi:hypothetical protein
MVKARQPPKVFTICVHPVLSAFICVKILALLSRDEREWALPNPEVRAAALQPRKGEGQESGSIGPTSRPLIVRR